jgi:hypothetical protein
VSVLLSSSSRSEEQSRRDDQHSGSEPAPILRIIRPRWAFTVMSSIPRSPPSRFFSCPPTTSPVFSLAPAERMEAIAQRLQWDMVLQRVATSRQGTLDGRIARGDWLGPKLVSSGCQPASVISSSSDSRTGMSSSTTNTIGPLRDETGQICKRCGKKLDGEDRRRVQEGLRAGEPSWRQIVDNIPGFVAIMRWARVEYLNRLTLDSLGSGSFITHA